MDSLLTELSTRLPELRERLAEHLVLLTLLPVSFGVLIGIPLAMLVRNHPSARSAVIGMISIIQTIPSLAMLAFLLSILGMIGKPPAIIALTLYSLLPIVQATLTGISNLSPSILHAADGIGFSPRQRLWMVELPLATPVILSGVRTATVICVGIATLSTFIGAGGLGDFINRGLALSQNSLLIIGAGMAAILALVLGFALDTLTILLQTGRRTSPVLWRIITLLVLGTGAAALFFIPLNSAANSNATGVIRIGSKNFTEQIILGEIMAIMIEENTTLGIDRRFNLGGTMICHQALSKGAIDLYAEYTGTALTSILGREASEINGESVFPVVRKDYLVNYACQWFEPFGFDNTYAISTADSLARRHGWHSISDLKPIASMLSAGFTAEFIERPDGYPGLSEVYGFRFGSVRDFSPKLMYQAAASESVEIICAFATDGRIAAHNLVVLTDNRNFFPPYEAAPVVRERTLQKHPELRPVLKLLAGLISTKTMQSLNREVYIDKKSPYQVARNFLIKHQLIR